MMTPIPKPPGLAERVAKLKCELSELRRLQNERTRLAGPQRIEDSHTEAKWLGLVKQKGNGA